jgi:hypothetical protein
VWSARGLSEARTPADLYAKGKDLLLGYDRA